jgi:hypothetical protein
MSKIEVNTVEPQCGTTLTLGASGDTVTIPSGATISNLGTAAGFGSTGEVSWNTTKVTTGFTATSGVGYFADTTGSAFTITLPSSPSAGNVVAISDYSGNFGTNAITVGRNSSNINGSASDFSLSQNNITAQFIYVDGTQGWRVVFTGSQTGEGLQQAFVCATGGTITNSGGCRIHTFTGPGTFTVNSLADTPANNVVSYIVVGGGGGGGAHRGGGGGAGGFREDKSPVTPYTASPLDGAGAITVTATAFPITVGGGGAGEAAPAPGRGDKGNTSTFSTITSAGGGSGRNDDVPLSTPSDSGGSGGGGGGGSNPVNTKGEGNTPPVSPSQGTPGADSIVSNAPPANPGGGGGGATAPGVGPGPGGTPGFPAAGGAGATTHISGSPVAYAGGGGGGPGGAAGTGGGGAGGAPGNNGSAGTANTGGGGGGGASHPYAGGAGGSGVVIIRYKVQ